jgi:predicted ABC-type ATPase
MASPQNSRAPVFWIIGGPNGSGKSTAYSRANVQGFGASVWIVNPDLLTARLQAAEKLALDAANLAAVQRLELWLEATLRVHQSVGVETVLSTEKYRRLVELATSLGFTFQLFYVMLASPELNVERVRARVLKGGHDVPEAKILDRYWRSLEQLRWFLGAADEAEVWDNSAAEPQLVLSKAGGEVVVSAAAPVNLLAALDLQRPD